VIIHNDPEFSNEQLREALYGGDLMLCTRLPSVAAFVEHARHSLDELFAPHDPRHVHEHIAPVEMAQLLGDWKPRFIHDDTSEGLTRAIVAEAGFMPEHTYYDVPKPRTSFPQGHLTTGIAFAFPWHRDTWYAAPAQQLNWWLPIYPVSAHDAMSVDPSRFHQAVKNDSDRFDYYRNNAARKDTALQITREEQVRPAATGYSPHHPVVVLPSVGSLLLFSGAQLHASIPNTSCLARYSIDFRTVDAMDLMAGRGAPMIDVHCTGTAIRDFRRLEDGAAFAEDVVVDLFGQPPAGSQLHYSPFEPALSGLPS
jgi:hypothetical protein